MKNRKSIKTSRCEDSALVQIDYDLCTVCGNCVEVCKGAPLYIADGKIQVDQSIGFGCIACGHCMAACPTGAIQVKGRAMSPGDVVEMPSPAERADYAQLQNLMLSRRSIRKFQDKDVDRSLIEKILYAASTAPMGIPPSDVGVVVFQGRDKVKELKDDLILELKKSRWFFHPVTINILRPVIGKVAYDAFMTFIIPLVKTYIEQDAKNVDYFFYDAPAALYFYGSEFGDSSDAVIAATYAMLAAETLGLGSCMLGVPPILIGKSKKIKEKYAIRAGSKSGMMLILGHSALSYEKAVKRTFADVSFR